MDKSLDQVSKCITSNETSWYHTPRHETLRTQQHVSPHPTEYSNPESEHEKASDKSKLKNILQSNCPVLFNTVRVVKDFFLFNEKLVWIKGYKETREFNAVSDSGLHLGQEKTLLANCG